MPGRVGGHLVGMLVDTGSAVTLVHCCVLEKAKIDFKLGMVSEPVVSANGQPIDIKGKCELENFSLWGECCSPSVDGCRRDARLFAWDRLPGQA